jgi:hypothetical protein
LIIQQPFIRDVYNFVRIHKTLKITPAMATKVTGRLWEIGDIVDVLEVLRDAFGGVGGKHEDRNLGRDRSCRGHSGRGRNLDVHSHRLVLRKLLQWKAVPRATTIKVTDTYTAKLLAGSAFLVQDSPQVDSAGNDFPCRIVVVPNKFTCCCLPGGP